MNPGFYGSYLFSVPPSIILATALVFVITAGEIDLSFPAVIGAGGGIFMTLLIWGVPIMLAAVITLALGAMLGAAVGAIIVYGKISSLVATLGLSFFIVGIVNFLAQGQNLEYREAVGTWGNEFFVGKWDIFGLQVPNHFFIALVWVAVMYVLFRNHRFRRAGADRGRQSEFGPPDGDQRRTGPGRRLCPDRRRRCLVGSDPCADGEHGLVPAFG
jgi:simple sugar transport system permease protein